MKINEIKTLLLNGVLAISTLFFIGTIDAQVTEEECSEEIIISYFPEPFVKKALQNHKIPEHLWNGIAEALKDKNEEVIRIVEEKANAMDPNPLKDPKHRQEAIVIFRDALTTTFTKVMNKNGITDNKQIYTILEDIQKQKAERFSKCLEKHMKETEQKQ